MANWTINNIPLADLGIKLVSGSLAIGQPSEMRLEVAADFDEPDILAYGAPVVLAGESGVFFRGKVASVPVAASAASESQTVLVRDAWADLEEATYQEMWKVGTGEFLFPEAVLGMKADGTRIPQGAQIREVISFAAGNGVDIMLGNVPDGVLLWPSEIKNQSCAEVIRDSLRLQPDWVPWLDYATSPPTFHVTPAAELPAVTYPVDGSGDVGEFQVIRRDDLQPESVRIVYTTAAVIDGEVFRDGMVDKFPPDGPDSGPRAMGGIVELAGLQMQFQKSRIQTRALPTNQASAKVWLKLKFPHLADVPDDHFAVTGFAKELVADDEDLPPPINPAATRLGAANADQLPRELVRGGIEDWMRRRVGKVRIEAKVRATAAASPASRMALAKTLGGVTVTATNAVTKTYKGITQWSPPETAPAGFAQAIYQGLQALRYEGSVELREAEISSLPLGRRLNLSGGREEWAAMNAPITTVDFDVDSGVATLGYGAAPFLEIEEFVELQRIIRARPAVWWSGEERASNELGSETDPGSRGDTVSPFDSPETLLDPPEEPPRPLWVTAYAKEGGFAAVVSRGFVVEHPVVGNAVELHEPANLFTSGAITEFEIVDGGGLYVEVLELPSGRIGVDQGSPPADPPLPAVTIFADDGTVPEAVEAVHYAPPIAADPGRPGRRVYQLAAFALVDGEMTVVPVLAGKHIPHFPVLPTFQTMAGLGLPIAFDSATGKYRLRGLTATAPLEVVDLGTSLDVRMAEGGDYNVGYRGLTITQDSDPPWVNFVADSTINRWIYVRGGIGILDRTKVATPDDEGVGPGLVYPRFIHLLPISNAGTAGTGLDGDARGGWIEPEP